MRVLFNTTVLHIGGALQASNAIVLEALADSAGIDWQFALSAASHQELQRFALPADAPFHVFDRSPARHRDVRRSLRELEARMRPDCVFTFFGPPYVRFQAPHLCGIATPWASHATLRAYRTLDFPLEWAEVFLLNMYRGLGFRRADAWVVEAECVRQGMHRRFRLPLDRIALVPNTCGQHYHDQAGRRPFPAAEAPVRILCFAAPYKHKNLAIVPDVARALRSLAPGRKFEFVITIPHGHKIWPRVEARSRELGVADSVVNLGVVPVAEGPALFQRCDICFMPTVLECFSATYPEAMAMGLPIVGTDLDFVHDLCGDAALYYPPFDAEQAAQRIVELLGSQSLWNRLIDEGKRRLAALPTPRAKYERYVDILQDLAAGRSITHASAAVGA